MLILARKEEESIIIKTSNGLISIKVVECGKNRVRLGIKAPRNVSVDREEIYLYKYRAAEK